MAARPRSPQTSARSFRKPCENAIRLPSGRPLGFPETPGGHIRPFTCLVGSRARRSVSFCYGREFLSTALVCLAQKPFLLFPSVSFCFLLFPSVSFCFLLFPSVSFCYGREFLSTALPTSMTPPPDP